MSKRPWFKFFPSDWQGDLKLRSCSLAARGLWAEIVCVMNSADPKGYLVVNGDKPNFTMLSTLCGAPEKEVKKHLKELENAGVFSLMDDGTIYSRRIVRDEEKSAKNRRNGSKGGNPALKETVNLSDNPTVKPSDKTEVKPHIPNAIFHIPEARNQTPDLSSPPSGDSTSEVISYSTARGGS